MPSRAATSAAATPSMAVRRNASQVCGSTRSSDLGHGQLEQLLVVGLFQVTDQVDPRLHRVEQVGDDRIGRPADAADLIADEVTPTMRRQGAQPAAEAPRRVVGEVGQVSDELEQDHLCDVLGVGVLELPSQAPGVDLRAVAVDERRPGRLIARVVAQGHQDADARAAAGCLGHDPTPRTEIPCPAYSLQMNMRIANAQCESLTSKAFGTAFATWNPAIRFLRSHVSMSSPQDPVLIARMHEASLRTGVRYWTRSEPRPRKWDRSCPRAVVRDAQEPIGCGTPRCQAMTSMDFEDPESNNDTLRGCFDHRRSPSVTATKSS